MKSVFMLPSEQCHKGGSVSSEIRLLHEWKKKPQQNNSSFYVNISTWDSWANMHSDYWYVSVVFKTRDETMS